MSNDPQEPVTTSYRFTEHGGEVVIDGKTHWPDYLTVHLDRYMAFDLAKILLNQLANESRQKIVLQLVGLLEEQQDDSYVPLHAISSHRLTDDL
jgi:hypothetical protein